MRPSDHPDFFRAARQGGTRESSIVLDRDGRFWHEGSPVDRPALARALHRWIARHPEDGRLILTNGFDWCYFRAEDAPYIVRRLHLEPDGAIVLVLSDDTREPLDAHTARIGDDDVVYVRVKQGAFEARFSRSAQADLAPLVVAGDPPALQVRGVTYPLARRSARP